MLIDADSQGTLTDELGFDPEKLEQEHKTLADPLSTKATLASVVVENRPPLIGSNELLDILEKSFIQNNVSHTLLRNKLKSLRAQYDFILIDCGPKFSEIMYHILTAADYVIIPVKPDHKSARGIQGMYTKIKRFAESSNPGLKVLCILPTMYDKRSKHHRDYLQKIREWFKDSGVPVYDPINVSRWFDRMSDFTASIVEAGNHCVFNTTARLGQLQRFVTLISPDTMAHFYS